MRRLAAMAAPPMFSDVLIMRTLIRFSIVSANLGIMADICHINPMILFEAWTYAPKSPFNVRFIRLMALAMNELVLA